MGAARDHVRRSTPIATRSPARRSAASTTRRQSSTAGARSKKKAPPPEDKPLSAFAKERKANIELQEELCTG